MFFPPKQSLCFFCPQDIFQLVLWCVKVASLACFLESSGWLFYREESFETQLCLWNVSDLEATSMRNSHSTKLFPFIDSFYNCGLISKLFEITLQLFPAPPNQQLFNVGLLRSLFLWCIRFFMLIDSVWVFLSEVKLALNNPVHSHFIGWTPVGVRGSLAVHESCIPINKLFPEKWTAQGIHVKQDYKLQGVKLLNSKGTMYVTGTRKQWFIASPDVDMQDFLWVIAPHWTVKKLELEKCF